MLVFFKKTWLFNFKAMESTSKMISFYLVILRVGSGFFGLSVLKNGLVPDPSIVSFFFVRARVGMGLGRSGKTQFFVYIFRVRFLFEVKKRPMLGPCFIILACASPNALIGQVRRPMIRSNIHTFIVLYAVANKRIHAY